MFRGSKLKHFTMCCLIVVEMDWFKGVYTTIYCYHLFFQMVMCGHQRHRVESYLVFLKAQLQKDNYKWVGLSAVKISSNTHLPPSSTETIFIHVQPPHFLFEWHPALLNPKVSAKAVMAPPPEVFWATESVVKAVFLSHSAVHQKLNKGQSPTNLSC